MNKTAIKNYAVWARNELIERVTQRAFEYGVTKNSLPKHNTESINGRLLSVEEKNQLNALITKIERKGFDQVIEEVAYTWFNRFIALRFMEVNNYLPQRIRVFTNESNEFKPQILTEAIHFEVDGIDKQRIFDLVESNNQEELYKYLLISLCNDMGNYLPGMFTRISDYKVLLFPNNLLREGSVLSRMISDIDEDSWTKQVEVIGWLYQYYVSERHNQINDLKGAVKKEDIPAATQLFTTDWIVKYMVDNSLGRYWIERNPNSSLKETLEFLVTSKDGSLPYIKEFKKPEELTFFDPCMGSGHILVYAFDVLMEIYRECGYSDRDAAKAIVENNLFGIDIDERAYQLAYFAVMMKARSYNRRILSQNIANNLSSITETNGIDSLSYFGMKRSKEFDSVSSYLIDTFKDALELGSLIEVKDNNYNSFDLTLEEIKNSGDYTLDYVEWCNNNYWIAKKLSKQASILSRKYTITTTNPPYMGKLEGKLKQFVFSNYKDYSSDLFSVFIKRNFKFTSKDGYMGFMVPNVWMFIKSYEALRKYIIDEKSITTLIQLAKGSFYKEATVDVCTMVLSHSDKYEGVFFNLERFKADMEIQKIHFKHALSDLNCDYRYEKNGKNFNRIVGSPIAYWISDNILSVFEKSPSLIDIAIPKQGMATTDNGRFLRLWHEVKKADIGFGMDSIEANESNLKWFPINKGGEFRKWYGNNSYVVNYQHDGKELIETVRNKYERISDPEFVIKNRKFYFIENGTWSAITSGDLSVRYSPKGYIISNAGMAVYNESHLLYIIAFLNANCTTKVLIKVINQSLNFNAGDLERLPLIIDKNSVDSVEELTISSINISKADWNSFETSWDFVSHPFVRLSNGLWDATSISASMHYYYGKHIEVNSPLELCYMLWQGECNDRFKKLKENEEELNRIFIDIYGLQDELVPAIEDKNVTVRKAELTRDIKSFISYAVGCMFGRYSLDIDGLAYTGGEWNSTKYRSYLPDNDNIIPICDDEYFEDDIVGRFTKFVETVFGKDTLEANLSFISKALGGSGDSRNVIRNYFLNEFFKDHCNTYQVTGSGKRPIYWLFDSGKKNGFKALMYIHRYTPDLIARMRTDYIHPQQSRYRTQIEILENQIKGDISTSERVKLTKQLTKIKDQAKELADYEEKIHHWADKMEPMDLDDGVKVNYAKFQELLAKIK